MGRLFSLGSAAISSAALFGFCYLLTKPRFSLGSAAVSLFDGYGVKGLSKVI